MNECTCPRVLLAKNMKRLRRLHGYSQATLAELVGCSVTMIGNVETLRKFPSPENLEKIAVSLEAPVRDLFVDTRLKEQEATGAASLGASGCRRLMRYEA